MIDYDGMSEFLILIATQVNVAAVPLEASFFLTEG